MNSPLDHYRATLTHVGILSILGVTSDAFESFKRVLMAERADETLGWFIVAGEVIVSENSYDGSSRYAVLYGDEAELARHWLSQHPNGVELAAFEGAK